MIDTGMTKTNHPSLLTILAIILSVALSALPQEQVYPAKKPAPTEIHPNLLVIGDEVVREQWTSSPRLVNAPTDIKQIEPGQCVRFAVIATGDERDRLLNSATFSFDLSFGERTQTLPVAPAAVIKQIKPEGGDFVTQALGAAGIKNPLLSVASLAASAARWCAPDNVQDGSLKIVARAVLENKKSVALNPAVVEVRTFETARKKPAFGDMQTFGPWLQAYHNAPDPAHLLDGLRLVSGDAKAGSAYNVMAFFVAALKASPAAADDVIRQLPTEPVAVRIYAIPLLRIAGYQTDALLNGFKGDKKAVLESVALPDTYDLKPDRVLPTKMDMLWGEFFATGRMAPVKAIASMLAWREDYDKFNEMRKSGQKPTELTDSIMRGVVYTAAGWSLSAISRNDGVVADYIDELKSSPETSSAVKAELANLYTNPAFSRK